MNIKIKQIKIGLDILALLTKISFAIGFLCVTTYFIDIGYFPIESSYSTIFHLILSIAFESIFIFIVLLCCFIYAPLTWIKLLSMPDVFFWWNKNNPSVLDSYNVGNFDFDFKVKLRIILRYIAYTSLFLLIFLITSIYVDSKSFLMLYPTVAKNQSLLRIAISAAHSKQDISLLCRNIKEIL
ncbi:MAG: hypothetical protein V4471_00875 [Pseudomonadota bacterium]